MDGLDNTIGVDRENEPALTLGRVQELDALRGVAAFVVLLHHCFLALPEPVLEQWLWLSRTPLRMLVLGRPAVILFLVLSGFVLTLSLVSRNAPTYGKFVVRRIFRIYAPFAISIFLAALAYSLVDPRPLPQLSEWFRVAMPSGQPSFEQIGSHLLMVGREEDVVLNNPMWSLIVEMRLSIVFPFLFFMLFRRRRVLVAALIASLLVSEAIREFGPMGLEPSFNASAGEAGLLAVYFAFFFLLGMALAAFREDWTVTVSRLNRFQIAAITGFALLGLSSRNDLAAGLGAAALIMLLSCVPAMSRFMRNAALQWLGQVSYSLYLTHAIVIGIMVFAIGAALPQPVILLLAIPTALVVAHLMHHGVERPCMNLGRRLTR